MFDIIDICHQQTEIIESKIKGECVRALCKYHIEVDEEQLVKAITDARSFYDKGYDDGKAAAMAEIVYCKDCKHYIKSMMLCTHEDGMDTPDKMDFCSLGERWQADATP